MTLAIAGYFEPWWIQIIKALLIFGVALGILPLIIVYERKLLGRFQGRYGPNRVGPFGLLQPLAEIVKFATKEDSRPVTSVGPLYLAAPVISIISAVARVRARPLRRRAADLRHARRPLRRRPLDRPAVRLRVRRDRLLRADARRLGVGLEVLVPRRDAGRGAADLLRGLPGSRADRRGHHRRQPVADGDRPRAGRHVVLHPAVRRLPRSSRSPSFAETNRSPFDLVEADAELVAGYFTEYGGTRMVAFLFAEYLNMMVVSGLAVTLFLGGWLLPFGIHPPAWVDPFIVLAKMMRLHHLLHLDPRDAAAPALRPADELRLEDPAAARDAQRARDGDHRRGGAQVSWTPMTWSPGADQIAVQRAPAPGAAGGAYRAFGETLRGLKTTFARVVEGVHTIQYPEQKVPVYPRFRGRHKLHRFEDTGLEKCVGCSLCAAACPSDCIRVVAAENTPEDRVSAGERYAAVYEINISRCIFCGYCEVACPFDAITMGHDFELSDYNRSDLIFTKEMLLAEPVEATPLRAEGE